MSRYERYREAAALGNHLVRPRRSILRGYVGMPYVEWERLPEAPRTARDHVTVAIAALIGVNVVAGLVGGAYLLMRAL